MRWVRVGNHILNPASIVEVVDQGEHQLKDGAGRTIEIKLISGDALKVAGVEADAIWDKLKEDAEVWSDTLSEISNPFGFA